MTTPAGATLITVRNVDGSTARVAGTGQREMVYTYDLSGSNERVTTKLPSGEILTQSISNAFGQTLEQASPNTLGGFIYTRSEYNAKGQLVKQYQDTGSDTEPTAPSLYEYDSFGNQVKQTLALSDTPTKDNSPVVEMAYSVESMDDGIYTVTTQTRYNAEGVALSSSQKQLISQLSSSIENKSISISERGLTSTQWSAYNTGTKRTTYSNIPTSTITAETVTVDGFVVSRKDNAGITATATRAYASSGMTITHTDGRGNATITAIDIAGRAILVTDAADNSISTTYCACCDQPATVTDALGNTSCYRYDERGRKVAEWGTGIQPLCYAYDAADRLISLTTFRVSDETITTDPTGRIDGDATTWGYHDASGLETSKTYADAKCCCNGNMVTDDYVKKAANMCHNFVNKYSHNGQVILSVECVAKCLSEAEDEHMEIKDCSDRNSARLLKHVSCYASCAFFLFDSHSLGTPEGGWEMGFNELLPDLGESIKRRITEIFN